MREMKFRCKRLDNGEWVYGDLVTCSKKHAYIVTYFEKGELLPEEALTACKCVIYKVKTETVGQYTGRCDKNGKKIYESDHIFASENVRHGHIDGVVFWKETGWYVKDLVTEDDVYLDCCSDIEIIGIIHDNPEPPEVSNG